jgi:hypothetical protein
MLLRQQRILKRLSGTKIFINVLWHILKGNNMNKKFNMAGSGNPPPKGNEKPPVTEAE